MEQESKALPTKVDEATAPRRNGKRPYRSPALRRLGTVRELTLSGSGCAHDGGTMRHMGVM